MAVGDTEVVPPVQMRPPLPQADAYRLFRMGETSSGGRRSLQAFFDFIKANPSASMCESIDARSATPKTEIECLGPSSSTSPLLALPQELQDIVVSNLAYPDLLALKHAHPHYNETIRTTKIHRLNWLIERAQQKLPLPQKSCRWHNDKDFCASDEIRTFMRRRRWHLDCPRTGKGCLVVGGTDCLPQKVRESMLSFDQRSNTFLGSSTLGNWLTDMQETAYRIAGTAPPTGRTILNTDAMAGLAVFVLSLVIYLCLTTFDPRWPVTALIP